MLSLEMKSSSSSFILDMLSHGWSTSPGCFSVLKGSRCLVLVGLHGQTASPSMCRVVNSELDIDCHRHVCTDMSYLSFNPNEYGLLGYFVLLNLCLCLYEQLVVLYDRVFSLIRYIASRLQSLTHLQQKEKSLPMRY